MKWPTMDEFAQNVAEKVLDEYEYKGRTIRQWIEIISASELSTNLAEVGTDCISRRQAIETFKDCAVNGVGIDGIVDALNQLPLIQPKRGKWHYSDGKHARIGLSFGVVCDQCGTESEYCTNFCGECGADMRGEQDG